ncbi:MAG: hypothetical protein PHN69_07345 [Candidatus Pacebacteria bacterium]|nr:hypothetical protein [Candidatus Paceibacterota bacterium]
MKFIDAEIPANIGRVGDYNEAIRLINTTDWSNKEIALKSGVSKLRIPPLRRKLRTNSPRR